MYPIPPNATRIRYLQTTGTQYIDSGIAIKSGLGFRASFDMPASNKGTIFGARNSDRTVRCLVWLGGSSTGANNLRMDYGGDQAASAKNVMAGENAVISINDNVVNGYRVTESGYVWTYTFTKRTFSANLNIFVCGLNNGGSIADRPASCKCRYLKILDGETVVRDYVPVRVGQTGYLFDRVSGQLFGNSGTGSFTLGPDAFAHGVVPTRMMAMGIDKNGG